MNIVNYTFDEQNSEFYPTPEILVKKMLQGIEFSYIQTILEPSAGKGDILREIAKKDNIYSHRGEGWLDIDCIEVDPNLRQILQYNFGERRKVLLDESKRIRDKYYHCYSDSYKYYDETTKQYETLPRKDLERLKAIDNELNTFFKKGIHIIHDDFFTYTPFKQYDLIIMNPPFSNGDRHLLKALDIQKNGGSIVCLLNAETIRNPYTETRKELVKLLKKYNATIEYIDDAFVSAERRTGVKVALVKVFIEQAQEESDIYNHFKKAEEMRDFDPNVTDLEVTDYIKAAVTRFNVEVKAGVELIRQYRALIPYMFDNFDESDKYKKPILRLTDSNDRGYEIVSQNEYLKKARIKYWKALLSNPKFVSKLTSKLQKEYHEKVEKLADYDFTEFNIYTLSAEMNAQVKKGIEDEILSMFDRLTEEHSYYPECSKNRHLYNGWKTNKAHKIDKKVIIHTRGVWDEWDGKPRVYSARAILEDIEMILNFLDGHMTEEVDSWERLDNYFKRGITKNIDLKYFTATFYKKGTVHLVFTCPKLIERFNIYAAQNKQWLPPCYGKKTYKDMTAEEKAVVDSFQGEEAYKEVMAKASYYFAPVNNENKMILIGE